MPFNVWNKSPPLFLPLFLSLSPPLSLDASCTEENLCGVSLIVLDGDHDHTTDQLSGERCTRPSSESFVLQVVRRGPAIVREFVRIRLLRLVCVCVCVRACVSVSFRVSVHMRVLHA